MNYGIEILRLIAVVLITFTHTRHNLDSGVLYYITENLPKFGTLALSVISGYLYWKTSKNKQSIFLKKVKTLAIPYLLANAIVTLLVLSAYYFFGYNFLNRLSFDYTIITEGLLALNSPPVNPPTYFIRDIFIIFTLIELVRNRNFYMLLIIVPYAVFGKLLLRYDILVLFLVGVLLAVSEGFIKKNRRCILSFGAVLCAVFIYCSNIDIYRYPIAFFVFILFLHLRITFFNAGGYSYLLHLYHSPVIVATFPLLVMVITDPYMNIIATITIALFFCYALYLLTRKYGKLKILSGGR